jgi:GTP cyclohydrolase IA
MNFTTPGSNGRHYDAELSLLDELELTTEHAYEAGDSRPDQPRVELLVTELLKEVGEDPQRDGLLNTPRRVNKMLGEILSGYTTDPIGLVNNAIFDVDYSDMVIVRDIEVYSLCEHHLLPFIGKAHVAYLPNGRVIGLSKIPRIVDMYARRLQVQERLTNQIADFLDETIKPRGVAVVIEAAHLCAAMRGVKKPDTRMITSTLRGEFKQNPDMRQQFMEHLNRPVDKDLL